MCGRRVPPPAGVRTVHRSNHEPSTLPHRGPRQSPKRSRLVTVPARGRGLPIAAPRRRSTRRKILGVMVPPALPTQAALERAVLYRASPRQRAHPAVKACAAPIAPMWPPVRLIRVRQPGRVPPGAERVLLGLVRAGRIRRGRAARNATPPRFRSKTPNSPCAAPHPSRVLSPRCARQRCRMWLNTAGQTAPLKGTSMWARC